MGNQAVKVNRKIEELVAKTYNYFKKQETIETPEEQLTFEVSGDELFDEVQPESIIQTSITKDEFLMSCGQNKRKPELSLEDYVKKKVCSGEDKENIQEQL